MHGQVIRVKVTRMIQSHDPTSLMWEGGVISIGCKRERVGMWLWERCQGGSLFVHKCSMLANHSLPFIGSSVMGLRGSERRQRTAHHEREPCVYVCEKNKSQVNLYLESLALH